MYGDQSGEFLCGYSDGWLSKTCGCPGHIDPGF